MEDSRVARSESKVPAMDASFIFGSDTDSMSTSTDSNLSLNSLNAQIAQVRNLLRSPELAEFVPSAVRQRDTSNSSALPSATTLRDASTWGMENWETWGVLSPRLRESLNDLYEAEFEAREEEYPIPSASAHSTARSLLLALHNEIPGRFEVYPTQDGEIAIDAAGGPGRSVLLLCASDGGVLCLVNMRGRHRRAHYSDAASLPDGFVLEALRELVRISGTTG